MVDRHIEESLNLVGMQVHGHQSVDTGHSEHIGHKFCSDSRSWLVLSILSGPSEIRDDGNNASCRRSFRRIDHKEQFHEVVAIGESRLNKIDVVSSDRLFEAHSELSVSEMRDNHISKRAVKMLTNPVGKVP